MLTVNQTLAVIKLDRDLKALGSALREDDLPRQQVMGIDVVVSNAIPENAVMLCSDTDAVAVINLAAAKEKGE